MGGLAYLGSGVRSKFSIKVYAVAVYCNDKTKVSSRARTIAPPARPQILSNVTGHTTPQLLDPSTEKTIRVVMARNLGQSKFFAGLRAGVTPRMNGSDLSKIDDFIALNPPGDFKAGDVVTMALSSGCMHFTSSLGADGKVESEAFCEAMADLYLGDDPVSPALKEALK